MSNTGTDTTTGASTGAITGAGTGVGTGNVTGEGYIYRYLLIFNWDPDERHPFKVFSVDDLEDVQEDWLVKKLNVKTRTKVVRFDFLEGEFSLFAKVEKSKFIEGMLLISRKKNHLHSYNNRKQK